MKTFPVLILSACVAAQAVLADGAFTVALRIKPEPFAFKSPRAGMIAHLASGYYDGYRLEALPSVRGLRPALEIGREGGAWMLEAPKDCQLPPGAWSHLAATWDGCLARIYLNGEVVAEGAYEGAFAAPRHAAQNKLVFATGAAFGLDYYPFEREDAFSSDTALPAKDIRARTGRTGERDPAAEERQARLYYRTLGVWYMPTAEDRALIEKEWAERPCNPYGPAPELPAANPPAAVAATRFFVAPDGRDSNSGSEASPFATLARARDAIRALKARTGLPAGGVTVFVKGGTYRMSETLALEAQDSGEPGSPVLYAAYGKGTPVFTGGFEVKGLAPADSPRLPASARGKALVADVRAQGFDRFEPLPSCGFEVGEYTGNRPMTDLYHGGIRQEPARWPNEGWRKILGGDPTNRTVKVELDDWEVWTREPGLMMTTYPSALWADLTCPVTGLDRERGEVTIAGRPDGRRLSRIKAGHPWFFVNALCALDAPGEWYLDREAGLLYVMPDGRTGPYVLSRFDGPFVTMKGVHDLEIRGLTLEYGRASAFVCEGLVRVTFARNVIRNFGNDALRADRSERVTIADSRLACFGHGGIRLSGGDRRTLTPSGNVVCGNDISRVEQWKRTYAPGLLLFGCGTRVERNRFHDMRSSAMRLEGNDFLIASNLVEDVVLESDDQGGIDIYANPTYALRIVGNVWRNIGRGGEFVQCGQAAVRFDDRVSNMIVTGNRFENCSWKHFGAIQMNCGRNNTIDRNVFVDCRLALSISRMKMEKWRKYVEGREGQYRMTKEVDVFSEPYRSRYPGIDRLGEMDAENRFWRNKLYGDTLPPPSHGGLTDMRANVAYASEKGCSLGALAGESMFWSRLGFFPDPIRLDAQGRPVVEDTLTPEMAARHRMMQDAGVRVHTSVLFSGWIAPGRYDYTYTDATLKHLFTAVPEARYLPRVKLNPPFEWIRANPGEVFVYPGGPTDPEEVRALIGTPCQASDGGGYVIVRSDADGKTSRHPAKIGFQSFASARWLADAEEALRRLIAHLRASPYAERIVGLHLAWGACGETCMWGRCEQTYGDKSLVFERAFRDWGGKGPVDAENYDFKRFMDHLNVSIANRFGKTVKSLMGEGFPVGIFYGYMLECFNSAYTGWLGYEELLKSRSVDFWAGPISYVDRGAGRPGGWLAPALSINRRRQWVDEIDVRTFRADPKWGHERCLTAAKTKAVLAREMCKSLAMGSLYWWMDLGGGWYDGPEMADIVRELERTASKIRSRPHESRADVLYVVDEDAMRQGPMEKTRFERERTSLRAMFLSGMLIDICRAADLRDLPLDRYKVIVSFNRVDSRYPSRTKAFDGQGQLPDTKGWRKLFESSGCRAYAKSPAAVYGDNRFIAIFPADKPETYSLAVSPAK